MDNEGGGAKEAVTVAPEAMNEMGKEADFGVAETTPVVSEQASEAPVTPAGEAVAAVLPPVPVMNRTDDSGVQNDDAPTVARDAERMPKEYAKHLVEIMRKYKQDPHQLQRSVTDLKWDYMRKAFGRKLGDGLDGKSKS